MKQNSKILMQNNNVFTSTGGMNGKLDILASFLHMAQESKQLFPLFDFGDTHMSFWNIHHLKGSSLDQGDHGIQAKIPFEPLVNAC